MVMNIKDLYIEGTKDWIYTLNVIKEERDNLLLDKIRLLEEMSSMCEDACQGDAIRQELEETRKRLVRE